MVAHAAGVRSDTTHRAANTRGVGVSFLELWRQSCRGATDCGTAIAPSSTPLRILRYHCLCNSSRRKGPFVLASAYISTPPYACASDSSCHLHAQSLLPTLATVCTDRADATGTCLSREERERRKSTEAPDLHQGTEHVDGCIGHPRVVSLEGLHHQVADALAHPAICTVTLATPVTPRNRIRNINSLKFHRICA